MQKTNKLFAVVLAFAMMFSIALTPTMAAAADEEDTTKTGATFTDVAAGDLYYQAIHFLASEDIVNGVGEGKFEPKSEVKRSEFAKMIVAATGAKNLPQAVAAPFNDVPADHWGSGFIKAAADMKMVNGYGDGNFGPDDPVTYEQAIKMAVVAVGYDNIALSSGGWPNGYRIIGDQIKITKGISDATYEQPMFRGAVAQLIYNMMETPQMDPNTNQKYDPEKTFMQDQGTEYSLGQITAVPDISLSTSHTPTLAKDEIEIYSNGDYGVYQIGKWLNGDINAAKDYLGQRVRFYYTQPSGADTPILSSVTPQNNTKTSIDIDMIDKVSGDTIEYREGADEKSATLTIDGNAYVMYNGKATDRTVENIYNNENITNITYMEANSGGGNDVVFVTAVKTIYVSQVDSKAYKIYDKYDNSITAVLDDTAKNKVVTFKKDGKTAKFTDIANNSIVSVAESDPSAPGKQIVEALIGPSPITGTIEEIVTSAGEFKIKGTTYKFSESFKNHQKNGKAPGENELKVGTYGKFYLDAFGKVAAVDLEDAADFEYAYLVKMINQNDKVEGKVVPVTSGGTEKVFTFAKNVKVNGLQYKTESEGDKLISDMEDFAAPQNTTAVAGPESISNADIAQLIKYRTNNSGEINEVVVCPDINDATNSYIKIKTFTGPVKYSGNYNFNNKFTVDSKTKVLFVPNDRQKTSDFLKKSPSGLKKDAEYYVQAIDIDNGKAAKVVLVFEPFSDTDINEQSDWYVVKGTGEENYNENKTEYIEVYVNGTTTTKKLYKDSVDIKDLQIGDVVRVNLDSDNYVTKREDKLLFDASNPVVRFFGMNSVGSRTYTVDSTKDDYNENVGTDSDFVAIYGTAMMNSNGTLQVTPALVDSNGELTPDEHYQPQFNNVDSVPILTYDSSKSGSRMIETEVASSEILGHESVGATASKVLVIAKDGVLKMVMIVK